MITQEYVQQVFDYRDGFLYWKEKRKNTELGGVAGSFNERSGYYQVGLDNKYYLVHRIIFLWNRGYLPLRVDHIDLDKTNNRDSNLREITHSKNMQNCRPRKNSSSQYLGVSRRQHKHVVSWIAGIQANLIKYHFGSFEEEWQAALAYNRGAILHFGEDARINMVVSK